MTFKRSVRVTRVKEIEVFLIFLLKSFYLDIKLKFSLRSKKTVKDFERSTRK